MFSKEVVSVSTAGCVSIEINHIMSSPIWGVEFTRLLIHALIAHQIERLSYPMQIQSYTMEFTQVSRIMIIDRYIMKLKIMREDGFYINS
jgi:hypothetical protein